ncbi:MAG TPA: thioredoxin domain-containing protein [Vicinamibacterales bacterium]|jgi:protein-disulfide isomerase
MSRALAAFALLAVSAVASAQTPASTPAPPMTQQQIDEAILDELKGIHQLLAKMAAMQPQAPRPQAPPPPTTGTVTGLKGFALGRADAPLTMVEFTDLQCPYCRQYVTSTFGEIRKNWIDTGKLRYISRDFPLSIHPEAMPAARAARCAGEQGKFWEMRTTLMSNANLLNPDYITKTAQGLKLDMKAFASCAASDKYDTDIESDYLEGLRLGITGTPTFVVGKTTADTLAGPMIVGAFPYLVFDQKLRDVMASIATGAK